MMRACPQAPSTYFFRTKASHPGGTKSAFGTHLSRTELIDPPAWDFDEVSDTRRAF